MSPRKYLASARRMLAVVSLTLVLVTQTNAAAIFISADAAAYFLMQVLPARVHVQPTPDEERMLSKLIPRTSSGERLSIASAGTGRDHVIPTDTNVDTKAAAMFAAQAANTLNPDLARLAALEVQLRDAMPEANLRPWLFGLVQRELGRAEIPVHSSHLSTSLNKKEVNEAIREAQDERVIAATFNYALTPDGHVVHLYLDVAVYAKSEGQAGVPIIQGEYIFQSAPIDADTDTAAVARWTENHGERIKAALQEGIARIIDALSAHLQDHEPAPGLERVKRPLASLVHAKPYLVAGEEIGKSDGWIVLRGDKGRYFILPQAHPAAPNVPAN